MNPAPGTITADGGSFGPRQAADPVDQAARQAWRRLEPYPPWLLAIRAGAWAVTGAGLCLTLLGSAAVIAWQLHRA